MSFLSIALPEYLFLLRVQAVVLMTTPSSPFTNLTFDMPTVQRRVARKHFPQVKCSPRCMCLRSSVLASHCKEPPSPSPRLEEVSQQTQSQQTLEARLAHLALGSWGSSCLCAPSAQSNQRCFSLAPTHRKGGNWLVCLLGRLVVPWL